MQTTTRRTVIDLGGLFASLIALATMFAGCAHQQLRWDTVKQSQTLTTIYEQQVLNNLAMFVHATDSLPFFSFPNAGASDVQDTGNLAAALAWARAASGFSSAGLEFGGDRRVTESWTLTPINDPRKLELMRCAYQKAAAPCTGSFASSACPNCEHAFRRFYSGAVNRPIPSQDGTANGITSDCLGHRCWFGVGCKNCVPRGCDCAKVGHYCDVYVWVLPEGQEELTNLTLAILDYAVYSPRTLPTKEVTWYFAANGDPVPPSKAVRIEKATLLLDADTPATLPPEPTIRQETIEGKVIESQAPALVPQDPVRTPIPNSEYLQFQQNLRSLTPRR